MSSPTRHTLARLVALSLAATGLTLVPLPAQAQDLDWRPPQAIDPSLEAVSALDLVVDAHGNSTVVFQADSNSVSPTVYASTRPAGGTWSTPERLGPGGYAQVASDGDGNLTAVWTAYDRGVIGGMSAATRPVDSDEWSEPVRIATAEEVSYDYVDQLVVHEDGSAAVVWDHPKANYTVVAGLARSAAGTWGAVTELAGTSENSAFTPSVVLDSGGGATAVWTERAAPYEQTVWSASTTGTGWGAKTQLGAIEGYATTQAAQNDSGAAVVVLSRQDVRLEGGDFLSAVSVLTRTAGGAWSAPTELARSTRETYFGAVSATIDSTGTASVSWLHQTFDNTDRIMTSTTEVGQDWPAPHSFQAATNSAPESLDSATTSDGTHVVVWTSQSYGNEPVSTLMVASRAADGTWTGPTVLTSPSTGRWPALEIGPDDTGVVAFTDAGGLEASVAEKPGLLFDIAVYDEEGNPIDGELAPGQYVLVEVTLDNQSGEDLTDVAFEDGASLVIDSRSPGGVQLTGVPSGGDPTTLDAGESVVLQYELTTTERGLAAANSKVSASGSESDKDYEDSGSLLFDIEDGQVVDEALGRLIMMQVIDRYLVKLYNDFVDEMAERGAELKGQLRKILSPLEFENWFGDGTSDLERMQAERQGVAPELVDARLPGKDFKGYTVEELNSAYNDSFMDEVGKGVGDWAKGWKNTGKKIKGAAQDAYGEALLASFWMVGNATPEERMEFEAKMVQFAINNDTSAKNIVNTVKREVPRWKENGTYFSEAVDTAIDDVLLRSPDLKAQLDQEAKARKNLLKLADTDPERFQREWAKRDAEIFNIGLPLILDTIVGGGVAKLGGVRIAGKGAGVVNSGEALGVIKNGEKAAGTATSVGASGSDAAGMSARTTEAFLADIDGATVLRSTDEGNVYSLPNLGGVPEITLDVKAGILAELEGEYAAATNGNIKLVEVLKPSSPLRKPGGVAKLELTGQKTGKPAMLDAGAPDSVLGEANVWHSPTSPEKLPEFKTWDNARQNAAMKEWKQANDRWAEWQNPEPGSKTERLKQCIGQRCTVPLDETPNSAGVQRFVTAEFETVPVKAGKAEGELIRVKHYEVEVQVDGRTVNRKTVVDNSPTALPQTADADAVAVAKQVGVDGQGRPIIEPLNRAEREFVMQKYIDKNIKARRSGLLPDAAEHGVTLVMDDASAKAAGKLLPSYGVPFLPEGAGTAYLQRIAKYVAPKGVSSDAMLEKMLRIVQSEGGFGQHAVVITKDSRYLGELAVSQW